MKKIIISVTNDLVTDQRVSKTCDVLTEMGYDILLVGRKLKNSLPLKRKYKTKRFRLLFNKGFCFYAEYNIRLFLLLLVSKKNILVANDLDTLLPNYIISVIQQKKLVFDSHELFSEIPELVDRKGVKKIWKYLENKIIPKLEYVITVSNGIKNYYKKMHNISATVIRNIPIKENTIREEFNFDTESKKIILYQGSINIGRGIELMIDTIPLLNDYILVIIGDGDIFDKLQQKVITLSLENKVKFLGKITPDNLKKLTPNATVGVSLEEDLGLNYRFALPNKIFDYLHANVPIIVSNLPEMSELVSTYKIGETLTNRTPEALASLIKNIVNNNYQKSIQEASKELNWTQEKKQLISIFTNLES